MQLTTLEILKECGINSVSQILSRLDIVIDLLKEDVSRVCNAKKFAVKDFDFAYKLATEATTKTIKKITKRGKKLESVQKLLNCSDINLAVQWLVQRLVSNVRNTADKRYAHLHFENEGNVSAEEYNCTCDYRDIIDDEILLGEIKKLPKKHRINAVRKVWQEARFDLGFDKDDLQYVCKLADISAAEVLDNEVETELKAEKTKSGHRQLFFVA